MELLDVDEIQAQAILDMQLRRLAALERQKIIDELAEIERTIADLQDILDRPERQRQIVRDELTEIVEKHGDDRRTQIVPDDGDVTNEDLIAVEDVVVTITQTGYAKRTKTDLYRAQKRGGKGVQGATLKQDDIVAHFFVCSTHDWMLFFTNKGRVYRLKAYELPEANRNARGQHVANLLAFQPDEQIAQVMQINNYQAAPYLVLATRTGLVKKSRLTDFDSPRSGGLIGINLREDDELVGAVLCSATDDLLLVSAEGQSIRFTASDEVLRPMGRATSGVLGMRFNSGDRLLSLAVVRPGAVRAGGHRGRVRQAHPDRGLSGAGPRREGRADPSVRPPSWHSGRGAHRRHRRRAVRDHLDRRGDPHVGPRGPQGRPADEGGPADEPGRECHAARGGAQRRGRRRRRHRVIAPAVSDPSPGLPNPSRPNRGDVHLVNDTTSTPEEPDGDAGVTTGKQAGSADAASTGSPDRTVKPAATGSAAKAEPPAAGVKTSGTGKPPTTPATSAGAGSAGAGSAMSRSAGSSAARKGATPTAASGRSSSAGRV